MMGTTSREHAAPTSNKEKCYGWRYTVVNIMATSNIVLDCDPEWHFNLIYFYTTLPLFTMLTRILSANCNRESDGWNQGNCLSISLQPADANSHYKIHIFDNKILCASKPYLQSQKLHDPCQSHVRISKATKILITSITWPSQDQWIGHFNLKRSLEECLPFYLQKCSETVNILNC